MGSKRILTAAMCNGMLAGVLEHSVAYAKQRFAFGRAIGLITNEMARNQVAESFGLPRSY